MLESCGHRLHLQLIPALPEASLIVALNSCRLGQGAHRVKQ